MSGARVPRLLFNAEIVITGMDEEATKRGAKMVERGAWRHVTPNASWNDTEPEDGEPEDDDDEGDDDLEVEAAED